MKALLVTLIIPLVAEAHLAHHWHAAGSMTSVSVLTAGTTSSFTYIAASPWCTVTDPDGDTVNLGTGSNTAASARSVCRMALKFNIGAGCSVNATTNMYVCSGEVDPANCTINSNQNGVTCN